MESLLKSIETMPVTEPAMWWGTLGTVRPFPSFRPGEDAQEIHTALEEKDVNTLVRILTNRTNAQRQAISQAYHTLTQKDLSKALKKLLSGALEELLLGLLMTPALFDAHRLRQAMQGMGTDEDTLLEVLCTRSAQQLRDISVIYKQEFGRYLENDLISETSKDFTKLLLAILKKEEENMQGIMEYQLIERDFKTLTEALSGKKADPTPWIRVLTTRDSDHLARVLSRWETVRGETVVKAVQSHFSGDLKLGLCVLVCTIQNTPLYLAQRLQTSMKKNSVLFGILVSRSEEDLLSVRVEYRRLTSTSLYSAILKEFKGDLQMALLALCRAEDL
ncbi:annexin A2 [Conger conger]|uniref:annexin A2 n=1 Tax=Conger conger TaxID=82655 RepID=UPI002A5A7435|nr:annexin A2 [Conger conger]